MLKTLIAAGLCLSLGGCWFVFIPGSLLQGNVWCVTSDATVGGKVKMDDGRIGTIKAVNGPSDRCSTSRPLKADIEF